MDKLKITMLGEFTLSFGNKTISEQSKRSRKIWPILEYLIAFHEREVSQGELMELLWGSDRDDNTSGALKTQMYRLRGVLAELGCPESIIINVNGNYSFNNKLNFEIDTELFEKTFKKAGEPGITGKEKMRLLFETVDLYTGDFLAKPSYESWSVPLYTYYRSIFFKAVHMLAEMLEAEGRFHDVETICGKAVTIDPYDETMYFHLIKALAALGDYNKAKERYEYIAALFLKEFGDAPSKELTDLYQNMTEHKKNVETDIDSVINDLAEKQRAEGAFYCEYRMFRHIYQLEQRLSQRSGLSIGVCLITITDAKGGMPVESLLDKAAGRLKDCVSRSLRGCDVFARYSMSQYIILLTGVVDDNCGMILKRIEKSFYGRNTSKDIALDCRYKNVIADSSRGPLDRRHR